MVEEAEVSTAVEVSMEEAASLVEDSTVEATPEGIAGVVLAEVAGLMEACAEIRFLGAARPDRGAGLQTAALAPATCRRAGIRLEDPATARAWPEGQASAQVPGRAARWVVRMQQLPTATGMDSAALRLIMPRSIMQASQEARGAAEVGAVSRGAVVGAAGAEVGAIPASVGEAGDAAAGDLAGD